MVAVHVDFAIRSQPGKNRTLLSPGSSFLVPHTRGDAPPERAVLVGLA
jgi:hypothetical protein